MNIGHPKITSRNWLFLWAAIVLYIGVFTWITLWKYQHNLYDNLDLAIFTNTLHNTIQGKWFGATIHPSSYLGDHFSPFLLLLAPLYALWQDPRLLLVLQTIVIGLCAWPLFKMTSTLRTAAPTKNDAAPRKNDAARVFSLLPLFVVLLWLCNPSVHNMTLFEFSLVPFAIFFLLWSLYFYEQKKLLPHIVLLLIAMTTREDIAFVALAYSVLSIIERRDIRWILTPLALSGFWLVTSFSIIKLFSAALSYKFLIYYGWLGGITPIQILAAFLAHPLQLLTHFFTIRNLEFILGLTFPFFFVVLKPHRYHVLLIPPLAQILLSAQGGGALILQTHYAGLFLITLFPLFIFHLDALLSGIWPRVIPPLFRSPQLWLGVTAAATLYAALTYGSMVPAFARIATRSYNPRPALMQSIIPADASVAASWSLLTPFSNRRALYSLHYALIEKNQFALTNYKLPADTEFIAINAEDLLKGRVHIDSHPRYAEFTELYEQNLARLFQEFHPIFTDGPYIILAKTPTAPLPLIELSETATAVGDAPELAGYETNGSGAEVTIRMPQEASDLWHYYITVTTNRRSFNLPIGYGALESDDALRDLTMHVYLTEGEALVGEPQLNYWERGELRLSGIKNLELRVDTGEK